MLPVAGPVLDEITGGAPDIVGDATSEGNASEAAILENPSATLFFCGVVASGAAV